jgi:hypothetical protein
MAKTLSPVSVDDLDYLQQDEEGNYWKGLRIQKITDYAFYALMLQGLSRSGRQFHRAARPGRRLVAVAFLLAAAPPEPSGRGGRFPAAGREVSQTELRWVGRRLCATNRCAARSAPLCARELGRGSDPGLFFTSPYGWAEAERRPRGIGCWRARTRRPTPTMNWAGAALSRPFSLVHPSPPAPASPPAGRDSYVRMIPIGAGVGSGGL